jgi:hypothetical protein
MLGDRGMGMCLVAWCDVASTSVTHEGIPPVRRVARGVHLR